MDEITRQKIKVKEVQGIKPIGEKGFPKLEFTDEAGSKWGAFSEALFPYIKPGVEIDADIKITKKESGEVTYTNRTVTQIYEGGQPVRVKRSSGSKSPEEMASIETQVAVKAITDLWINDKLPGDSMEVRCLRWWLISRIDKNVKPSLPQPDEPKPIVPEADLPKTFEELRKRCAMEWKLQPAGVLKELGVLNWKDIKSTPEECYKQIAAVRLNLKN